MSAATAQNRRAVLLIAALSYALTLASFVYLETPGLGIGHLTAAEL